MTELLDRLTSALAGHYVIERELGQGGMATVYLAEDVKHHRQVAIKVLRPELAAILGAERFLKEIEVTANLQHPNILPLYDSGEADSFLYYVMPYVEGESLRDRLNRDKQLGVEETVEIAKDIAAALDFAHERSIVHRDIKPENILLQQGKPLVADFGIALAVSHVGGARLTETGLSLGTPQYMSPEQATGERELTARSDVYSLGAVVYEMLVGDPPHTGNTVQAVIATVVSVEPQPISDVRPAVPANVNAAVRCALAKVPADRFAGAAEFAAALANPAFTWPPGGAERGTAQASIGRWKRLSTATLLVAFGAVLVALWVSLRPPSSSSSGAPVARLVVSLPEDQTLAISPTAYPLAISPDGRQLVYVGLHGGHSQLFLRPIGEFRAQALPGTDGARQPFFSPDGDWVGFFAEDELRRVALSGGAPLTIARASGQPFGASWGGDGTILYSLGSGLYRVSVVDGDPVAVPITSTAAAAGFAGDSAAAAVSTGTPRWPALLPDGEHALVTLGEGTGVLFLLTGELRGVTGDGRGLLDGSQARYLPTGHLVFYGGAERVRLVPFDVGRLEVTGSAVSALENVFRGPSSGAAQVVVSENGTLVYVTGGLQRSLVFVERDGRETPIDVEPRGYRFPRISPDGTRLAVIVDPRPSDVWLIDLRRFHAYPLTTEGHHVDPAWAPDGERLAFYFLGDQYWLRWREAGEPHRVASRPLNQFQPSWGPDDRILVMERRPETGADLVTLHVSDGTSSVFLRTPADEFAPAVAPDGRWVTHASNASGAVEVWVTPYPGPGRSERISSGGGDDPVWSRDGTELFYRNGNAIMVAEVRTTPRFTASAPAELFSGAYDFTQGFNWDVGPDGRFVMVKADPSTSRQFQVVLNWFAELGR